MRKFDISKNTKLNLCLPEKITLPQQVKIGHQVYEVVEMDYFNYTAADAKGLHFGDKNVIAIYTGLPASKVAGSLLHEVVHGIYEYMGLQDGDDEERVVTGISNCLCQVISDNPELFDFFKKNLKNM